MAANFPDPDEKKNAAQMLIFLLDTVAGYLDISQNAPLCDKARVLKCVLETLLVTVPQPDLHSAFECKCAQAKERIFRVLGGTSAGMELKKAAGAVYEVTRADRALVEKLVGSADGLSVERKADVIGDIALHQPCVSQLLHVFAVLLTCSCVQASCPPATLHTSHTPDLTSLRRQFGLSLVIPQILFLRSVGLSDELLGRNKISLGRIRSCACVEGLGAAQTHTCAAVGVVGVACRVVGRNTHGCSQKSRQRCKEFVCVGRLRCCMKEVEIRLAVFGWRAIAPLSMAVQICR